MFDLKNKKVLVIGLGLSGRAAARFLMHRGAQVTAVERNLELINTHEEVKELVEKGLSAMHETVIFDVHHFDLVVVSPGVPPSNPHYKAARKAGLEIIGEVELACRYIQQPVIAITGTNGKTTTTLLVAHVLNHAGKPALALGNVGLPLTAELDSDAFALENNILVLELSSFQLDTLHTKVVDVGVVLNITPDHLDRYATMNDYALSKLHLKDCLKPGGKFYLYDVTFQEYKHLLDDKQLTYGYRPTSTIYCDKNHVYEQKIALFSLPNKYQDVESHDVENLIAAYILCKEMGVTTQQFLEGFSTFKKPAHRLEFVRTIKDIAYYDDSKGTNLDAVIRAVNTLDREIVLIAGGVDKGAAYTPWISAFAGKVKGVFAIGQASKKIKEDLSTSLLVEERTSLEAAVKDATTFAKPGQAILLSPGCSSFDMFRDYAHRGEEFQRIVNTLEE